MQDLIKELKNMQNNRERIYHLGCWYPGFAALVIRRHEQYSDSEVDPDWRQYAEICDLCYDEDDY